MVSCVHKARKLTGFRDIRTQAPRHDAAGTKGKKLMRLEPGRIVKNRRRPEVCRKSSGDPALHIQIVVGRADLIEERADLSTDGFDL